jgi:hypothetical protein
MRKVYPFLAFMLVLLLAFQAAPVQAQNLSFQVPQQTIQAIVNSDGTLSLDYTIVFANSSSGDPIDIVDIGMPNYDYQISSMTAEINGKSISDIRDSEYVHPGVEVHLGSGTIQPGQSGTLHLHVGVVDNTLGKSTVEASEPYASIVFSPNYFDSSYVSGKTDYTFSIVLPAGMNSEEPRYHTPSNNWPGNDQPSASFDTQGQVIYTWTATDASSSKAYTFGASFPERLVPSTAVVATEQTNSRTIDTSGIMGCVCVVAILGLFIGIGFLSAQASKKRRLQYLPPKISVEGHGIKRGLTAVEAAILMETPLDRVMTMVLFSVLKKEAATVETREPLKLTVADPMPEGLQPYEVLFLTAFKKTSDRERKDKLGDMTVALVKSVQEKMKGFSRKETIDYYKSIIEKAWTQVEAAGTPEVKSETYDQVMDWTMLDNRWEDRTRQTFGSGPVFVPIWWWRYDPVVRGAQFGGGVTHMAAPSMPSSGGKISVPKLPGSDFAASMVNGVQTFSAGVVGNLTNFTSSITNRTNPIPKSTSSGSFHGGGGGGCACACACAGCACACAGGGR